jgi:hypothetical protein
MKAVDHGLTVERLREALSYDPETGIFRRKIRMGNKLAGEIAGQPHPKGYWTVSVDSHRYLAQRLAWFYVTGEWPPDETDHFDLNKRNNAFENLRLATSSQNKANRPNYSNASGVKGVGWSKQKGKWRARLSFKPKGKHLGFFDRLEDAAKAYEHGAKQHFGEFARAS